MNNNRHSWATTSTSTLSLGLLFTDWADFVAKSNIEDKPEYEQIFSVLYMRFGDRQTKQNTEHYVTVDTRYYIEDEFAKYEKAQEMWEEDLDRLKGAYSESKLYNVGDIQEDGIEDFDKYLAVRSTNSQSFDIQGQIEKLQNGETPFNRMILNICERLFQYVEVDDYTIQYEV